MSKALSHPSSCMVASEGASVFLQTPFKSSIRPPKASSSSAPGVPGSVQDAARDERRYEVHQLVADDREVSPDVGLVQPQIVLVGPEDYLDLPPVTILPADVFRVQIGVGFEDNRPELLPLLLVLGIVVSVDRGKVSLLLLAALLAAIATLFRKKKEGEKESDTFDL